MQATTIDAILIGEVDSLGPGRSAIRKKPQAGPVRVLSECLEGDRHASKNHGGPEKAVLHYAFEHYAVWVAEFPQAASHLAVPGAFGENLSSVGMTEATVCVGDTYRVGSVVLQACQPRQPCWKLGYLADAPQIPHRMQENGWTGWYYRVLQPGLVSAGDRMELVERVQDSWTMERVAREIYAHPLDREVLEQIRSLPLLGAEWRRVAENRLESGRVESWSGRLELPRR